MNEDFHYYATYCAASIAGYSPEESETICYSANFVDLCTRPFLDRIGGPPSAATSQLSMEMANAPTDLSGIQDITRIWSSFHFIPKDLYADVRRGSRRYKEKYRLICGPNGDLVVDTVNLAKGGSLQAVGIAMHVVADSWAHRNFAGTPSLVINNTNDYFYEMLPGEKGLIPKKITFRHSLGKPDDLDNTIYSNSLYQPAEKAIMNLGHGRAGHLPDYSFIRYKYLPAWADYEEYLKDNPSDYYHAFCQMLEALLFLRGERESFQKESYAFEEAAPFESEIKRIINIRQLNSNEDWKALGIQISGSAPAPIALDRFEEEYINAPKEAKDETFLGRFILGGLAQKSMVTNRIFESGNRLAGISVDYDRKGMRGNRDFYRLAKEKKGGGLR